MARMRTKQAAGLKQLIADAAEGRFPELARILERAGYSRGSLVGAISDIAQGLNVSPRRIKEWLAMGAPARGPGGYDILAWLKWRNDYLLSQINQPQAADADTKLKIVKTKREELKLARESREVLDADDVSRVWRRTFSVTRSIVLGIPDRVLMMLPDDLRRDFTTTLRNTVDEILGVLARVPHEIDKLDNWEEELNADPATPQAPEETAAEG